MIGQFSATQAREPFDLCIIGAGASGITIAHRLNGTGLRVLLLEGGGEEYDPTSQDVYAGPVEGYDALDVVRLRYFGGTTNHWTGFCRKPEPVDLQRRAWVPGTGWPIQLADIDPYLTTAAKIVGVKSLIEVADWADATRVRHLPLLGLLEGASVIGPAVRFATAYRDVIRQSKNVTLLLNASVTEIIATENARAVSHLRVADRAGNTAEVKADRYVVACGGLESARLLLNSDGVIPMGLGNGSGLVGKGFSDHRIMTLGLVSFARGEAGILGEWPSYNGLDVSPHLVTAPDEAERAGAPRCMLRTRRTDMPSYKGSLFDWDSEREVYELLGFSEPVPDNGNGVSLVADRDRFGRRRIGLRYSPSPLETVALETALKALVRSLGAAGTGRLQLGDPERIAWGCHHYGTVRMSETAAEGVVDPNLRVHGMSDLFVCSTGCYPNGGMFTPTMTLVALSLRLADHLLQEVR